jgi:hypothetical protein
MTGKTVLLVIAGLLAQGPAFAADPAPAAAKPSAQQPAATPATPTPSKAKGAVDRLQLDPTAITGNRELPKVMNIVPWKAAEPPGGPDRPLNSLVDEVLSPLDRNEFRREVTYYRDLTGQSAPVIAPGAIKP